MSPGDHHHRVRVTGDEAGFLTETGGHWDARLRAFGPTVQIAAPERFSAFAGRPARTWPGLAVSRVALTRLHRRRWRHRPMTLAGCQGHVKYVAFYATQFVA